jgi:hypothetical protein
MSSIFTAANVLSYAIQVAGLVLVGALLPRLLRVTSLRGRLAYFRALLVACFLLPFAQPWRPAPQATAAAPEPAAGAAPALAPIDAPSDGWTGGLPALPTPAGWPLPPLGLTLAAVAGCGIVLRFAWLALGLGGLNRLKRTAPKLAPRPSAVDAAVALVGTDADIRVTPAVQAPATFGVHSPVVLLPKDFPAFDAAQQGATPSGVAPNSHCAPPWSGRDARPYCAPPATLRLAALAQARRVIRYLLAPCHWGGSTACCLPTCYLLPATCYSL